MLDEIRRNKIGQKMRKKDDEKTFSLSNIVAF